VIIGAVVFGSNYGCANVSRNSPSVGGLTADSTAWFSQLELNDAALSELNYGDVILYRTPNEADAFYLGRIVGKPGDLIEMHEGVLKRNKQLVDEPYLKSTDKIDIPNLLVPKATVYVLIDHRKLRSKDSRLFGPIAASAIVGRVKNIKY